MIITIVSLPTDHGVCVVQAPLPTHNKHVPITTHKINVDNNNMPTMHIFHPPMGLKTKQKLCESPQQKRVSYMIKPNYLGYKATCLKFT